MAATTWVMIPTEGTINREFKRDDAMMDRPFARAGNLFRKFKKALFRRDLDTARSVYPAMMGMLTTIKNDPSMCEPTCDLDFDLPLLTRDVYETSVIMSVLIKDQFAYKRAFYRWRSICMTGWARDIPTGGVYAILRLNLVRLLVQNKISEFDAELQSLSDAMEEDSYGFMEPMEKQQGRYDRVFTGSEALNFLLSQPCSRDEIFGISKAAVALGSSSSSSSMSDGPDMMHHIEQILSAYIWEKHPEWELRLGEVAVRVGEATPNDRKLMRLINQALWYARDWDNTSTLGILEGADAINESGVLQPIYFD